MIEAFVITLREGVEAALIVGIVFAYLEKIHRPDLKRSAILAVIAAIFASVGVAVLLARAQFNEDFFEGIVMLVAAVFVISMILFMQRTSKALKGKIESKVGVLAGRGSRIGLFAFVFLMVLREGVETVLILSAVSLDTDSLMSFFGTLGGVACAVAFAIMFIRGSVRIDLRRFFRITSMILYFVAFQLIVAGLHELSEFGVLPSSRAEMRIVGPIVSNQVFFFVTILALAGLMILFEYRKYMTRQHVLPPDANAAQRRKAAAGVRRERIWMTAVFTCCFLFIFLVTAQFVYAMSTTALSPATAVTLTGSQVTVPVQQVQDDNLHRYAVKIGKTEVRFLLFRKSNKKIVAVADACSICGPVGFYKSGSNIICKMCASPVNAQTIGIGGGCNPIPLESETVGGFVVIQASALRALVPVFNKS
jgi:FTR1 family protein